jgi:hypothetical protein
MAQPTPILTAEQWTERLHAWAVECWGRHARRQLRKSKRQRSIWPLCRSTHWRWNRSGLLLSRGVSDALLAMDRPHR